MKKTSAGIVTLAAAATTVLSGCSGSSSSGSSGGSPSATPSALQTVAGTPLATAGAAGPNGNITAPASNAPGLGSPGGSEVFPHVNKATYDKLVNPLKKRPGVRAVTYYPQFNQLQIYFDKSVTSAQRAAVYSFIATRDPAAAPSPSATS